MNTQVKQVSVITLGPQLRTRIRVCAVVGPLKKYIYTGQPGNLNSEGKQKTVQVRGNVSFWGKFQ